MSSSRATTAFDDDDNDFLSMLDAMAQSSPIAPAAKHTHSAMERDNSGDEASDNERRTASAPSSAPVNQNLVATVQRYADKKHLRVEQAAEAGLFLKDPTSVQNTKLFINMLALGNQLKKFDDSKPSFEVSADLLMNIRKQHCDKHSHVTSRDAPSFTSLFQLLNLFKSILKNYCFDFDIPSGIENIPVDWAKLVAEAQEALSLDSETLDDQENSEQEHKSFAPDADHQNIFQLTTAIVKKTQCSVNIVLCARVALMRKVYLKHPGTNFWDKLDLRLAKIRKDADGDSKDYKIPSRAFRHILDEDQKKHGKNDTVFDETAVDEFQQGVDDLIDIGVINAATSVPTNDA
ncbi:hypothetical protein DFH08DRAFT_958862 [Mycena albidolilacea]|uniref:Uncharacterized protein n=1 Tax=Mycena albidolilacea TaxID=1033008 RepID=A0AAD7A5H4_9AGAR|nr:hypothetical protein DFH08DRAFT_958862 [Mycena albidolilacea]